jgi:NADH dehydrogenase
MSEKASQKAEKYLKNLGVDLHLNVLVKNYDNETVLTNTDFKVEALTFIWSAGVIGNPIKGMREECLDQRSQRFFVDRRNRVEGYDHVFAIGDIALMRTAEYPQGHPQVAQPAIQQGELLVKNFKRMMESKPLKEFTYWDKGSMATIGRNKAVADIKSFTLGGFLAWITWLGVHLFFLVGVRNRLVVFLNWVYNYFNFDRAARVIIRPYQKK